MSSPVAINLAKWVAEANPVKERARRQAVHTIVLAIASSSTLSPGMVLKGGILMALRFGSDRFTKDIDFSTHRVRSDFQQGTFEKELSRALALAVERLPYGLDCRVQSIRWRPAQPGASFPTLQIRIGHALKGSAAHRRLRRGRASDVVKIDYSFNERTNRMESLQIAPNERIQAYDLVELVAEKYRALLQQVPRNRVRRQDAYDLYLLLIRVPDLLTTQRSPVLQTLLRKAAARGISPRRDSLRCPEIRERSERDYLTLRDEIPDELPPFNQVFRLATDFYESLPWRDPEHLPKG